MATLIAMRVYFLGCLLLTGLLAFSQVQWDSACNCSVGFSVQYPKQAEKQKVSGKVVVEYDVDEKCEWSNPVVIEKAGYGFDEEVLRTIKKIIAAHNTCMMRCARVVCANTKGSQKFNFVFVDE